MTLTMIVTVLMSAWVVTAQSNPTVSLLDGATGHWRGASPDVEHNPHALDAVDVDVWLPDGGLAQVCWCGDYSIGHLDTSQLPRVPSILSVTQQDGRTCATATEGIFFKLQQGASVYAPPVFAAGPSAGQSGASGSASSSSGSGGASGDNGGGNNPGGNDQGGASPSDPLDPVN